MPSHDEFFDVYYDIGESLFDRIRSMMDCFYSAEPRTPDDLAALKTIRDHVVRAVAEMESIMPESVFRDLETIRGGEAEDDSELQLPPFFAELAEKIAALDGYVDHLTRSMKVYDNDHPEGFPNLQLDHLAHLRGLMILVKLGCCSTFKTTPNRSGKRRNALKFSASNRRRRHETSSRHRRPCRRRGRLGTKTRLPATNAIWGQSGRQAG